MLYRQRLFLTHSDISTRLAGMSGQFFFEGRDMVSSGDEVMRIETEAERIERISEEKALLEGPWWGRLISMWSRWMTGQAFNNVLLTLILTAIGAGFWFGGKYCVDVAIPSHIQTIQDGYEREGEANRVLLRELDENHRQERREWNSMMSKVLESSQMIDR